MKLITLLAALSTSVICSPNFGNNAASSQRGPACDYEVASGIMAFESEPEQAVKELNKIGCYEAAEAYKQENPSQKGPACDYELASGIMAFESEPEQAVNELNKIGCYEAAEAYKQGSPAYYFNPMGGSGFSQEGINAVVPNMGRKGNPSYYKFPRIPKIPGLDYNKIKNILENNPEYGSRSIYA